MSKQVNDMLREEGASRYARLKRYPVQRNGVEIWARQREEKRRQRKLSEAKWSASLAEDAAEPESVDCSALSGPAISGSQAHGWIGRYLRNVGAC